MTAPCVAPLISLQAFRIIYWLPSKVRIKHLRHPRAGARAQRAAEVAGIQVSTEEGTAMAVRDPRGCLVSYFRSGSYFFRPCEP